MESRAYFIISIQLFILHFNFNIFLEKAQKLATY